MRFHRNFLQPDNNPELYTDDLRVAILANDFEQVRELTEEHGIDLLQMLDSTLYKPFLFIAVTVNFPNPKTHTDQANQRLRIIKYMLSMGCNLNNLSSLFYEVCWWHSSDKQIQDFHDELVRVFVKYSRHPLKIKDELHFSRLLKALGESREEYMQRGISPFM